MLPRVRGRLTSMTNREINQRLKAFCHRRTRIRWALIQRKDPRLARVVTHCDGWCLFNGELTYTLCRRCISWKCWNITLELQCRLLENRAVCFLFMEALRLDVILHKDANMADCDYFLLEWCFWVEMWFKTHQKSPLSNAPTSFSLYFLFLYQLEDVVQAADNLLLKCHFSFSTRYLFCAYTFNLRAPKDRTNQALSDTLIEPQAVESICPGLEVRLSSE